MKEPDSLKPGSLDYCFDRQSYEKVKLDTPIIAESSYKYKAGSTMSDEKSQRFIKFIASEESTYLLRYHPNVVLLLMQVALRARREEGSPDGLKPGEAFIGDYLNAGIETEKKYRTAKKVAEQRGHLLIIETCRNRKKGATERATIGTKVKLISTTVYDINISVEGDRKGHRGATEGRPKGDELRKNKKEKKEKKNTSAPANAVADDLFEFFMKSRKEHCPHAKRVVSKTQIIHFEKLLKVRSIQEIQAVITYAHTDPFWKPWILTPAKLEEKFDGLISKMAQPALGKQKPKESLEKKLTLDLLEKNISFDLRGEKVRIEDELISKDLEVNDFIDKVNCILENKLRMKPIKKEEYLKYDNFSVTPGLRG